VDRMDMVDKVDERGGRVVSCKLELKEKRGGYLILLYI